jgi:hypothetical protein
MRRRLLSIVGALGLMTGLISSGVAAQADTSMSDSTFQTMVNFYATITNNGGTLCYAQPASNPPSPPGACTLNQSSTTQNNFAICVELSTANPASESCDITQTSTFGNNIAIIIQRVRQGGGTVESGEQNGSINQNSGAGSNLAATLQMFTQRFGNQNDDPTQTDQQNSSTFQTSTSGHNFKLLAQSSQQDAQSALGGTQSSGEDGTINQHSTGVSKALAFQNQHQGLTGGGVQSQTIDPRCCSQQDVNTGDVFQITQKADQRADGTAPTQDSSTIGECDSTGNCTIDQTASTNAGSQHNHLVCTPGVFCSIGIVCTTAQCSPCTPQEEGCSVIVLTAPVASLSGYGTIAVRGSVALSRSASRYVGVARSAPSAALLT